MKPPPRRADRPQLSKEDGTVRAWSPRLRRWVTRWPGGRFDEDVMERMSAGDRDRVSAWLALNKAIRRQA